MQLGYKEPEHLLLLLLKSRRRYFDKDSATKQLTYKRFCRVAFSNLALIAT